MDVEVEVARSLLSSSSSSSTRHGTTILCIRTPCEILVGVDSFSASIFKHPSESKFPNYEGYMSETEHKFVFIGKGIYATLCGSANRCNNMVKYMRDRILRYMVEGETISATRVTEVGATFFRKVWPLGFLGENEVSTVYIFFWKPQEKKYQIIEVGDEGVVNDVKGEVFGCGSGSPQALTKFNLLTTPKDVPTLKNVLIEAVLGNYYTGGILRVFSLRDGTCECKHEGLMLQELDNHIYANELFNTNSMFVMILKGHEFIMSRDNLTRYLQKRYKTRVVPSVHWLCVINDCFLVYRVALPNPSICNDWFDTSFEVEGKLVRRQDFRESYGTCYYFLAHATEVVLEKTRNTKTFEELARI